MPPLPESTATFQMASAVAFRVKQSEGIAIPSPHSWRVPRKVEWETGEDAQELEDALSANSSGSSPRRLGKHGDPSVGSLPKRARLGCKDRAGKLVITGSFPNQGMNNIARSAPAPAVSVAASAQFSSSPFARLTLQPGSLSNGANLHRLSGLSGVPSQQPAHSVDRTLLSGNGNDLLDREPGYSSKSSDEGFKAGFRLDPDMESDAESSFWPAEKLEALKGGVNGVSIGNGLTAEKSSISVLERNSPGAITKEMSVDERTDVIGRMSEVRNSFAALVKVMYR
jgi:hypothetical protein